MVLEDIFPVKLIPAKVTLLKCDATLILVDTGIDSENAEAILSYARNILKMPLESQGEVCILTHRHRDHVGGLQMLAKTCSFKVAAHVSDADAIEADTGVTVDLKLRDRAILNYCGGIQLILVPGHTEGNSCIFLKEKSVLIVGDTLHLDENGKLVPPKDSHCVDSVLAKRELRRLRALDFNSIIFSHSRWDGGRDLETGGKEKLEDLLNTIDV